MGCRIIDLGLGTWFIFWLALLVLILPWYAVSARRLHDLDRAAWWLLTLIIPILGTIMRIIWGCFKGSAGSNRFGPDPLAAK